MMTGLQETTLYVWLQFMMGNQQKYQFQDDVKRSLTALFFYLVIVPPMRGVATLLSGRLRPPPGHLLLVY